MRIPVFVASTIATAISQQNSATQEIAQSVQSVALGTREAAGNIAKVNRGAAETASASEEVLKSEEVLNSAQSLAAESTRSRRTRPLHGGCPRGQNPWR
jgi:methyl-accepting chemotaxis protein